MPKYFDIHSHLNFSDYDKDWDEVIKRLDETETNTIVVGTDFDSSRRAVELAEKHDRIYACIGVHPVDRKDEHFDISKYEELVKNPKVVCIGECGLDFFSRSAEATRDKHADRPRQEKLFREQIEFALEHDKPLMIHARDAYEELLALLEPLKREHGGKLRGNVHFFAGSWEVAERFLAIGFTLSFTGVITFTSDYDEVIRKAPLECIMAETDAPFVAPVPYRGKRNEPSYVSEVAKKIAEVRGEGFEVVRKALVENALNMIGC